MSLRDLLKQARDRVVGLTPGYDPLVHAIDAVLAAAPPVAVEKALAAPRQSAQAGAAPAHHVIQLGRGDRWISHGTCEGQPALFIEPCDPREPGTFGMPDEATRHVIVPGSLVLCFSGPESLASFSAVVDDLKIAERAAPVVDRLAESACFVIEAAWQYGFVDHGDGTLTCTETQLCNFIDAARLQGQKDVGHG